MGWSLTFSCMIRFLLTLAKNLWPAYLLASILILYGFWWSLPNPYQVSSFQADENVAVLAVSLIHFPHFSPHIFAWGTGLLYQVYLVKLVFTLGGLLHASNWGWILAMGRLLVFSSALGAITVLFLLGHKLFDAWTGRLAAIIVAVLPGFVINSHYFKTDVPMTFWMLVTILAAYQLLDTGNSRLVSLLGFLVGYTATVKYSGGVVFLGGCVAMAMASRRFHKRLSWVSYLACVGLGFTFGEPLVLLPQDWAAIVSGLRSVGHLNRQGILYYVARPPAWIDYPVNVFPFSLTVPMLIATAAALVWVVIRQRTKFVLILTVLAAYYPLLAIDNWRLVRYTVPMLPFAALLVAASVRALREWRIAGRIALVAVSALIIYAFAFSLSYVRAMAETDPRVQASRWIEEHIPKGQTIPEVRTFYLNLPQLRLLGYETADIGYSITALQKADSPYLLVSECATSYQAFDYYPQQESFFQFVADNYAETAHFENSQKLLFIDSKQGARLAQDWLLPNPRITILTRRVPTVTPSLRKDGKGE